MNNRHWRRAIASVRRQKLSRGQMAIKIAALVGAPQVRQQKRNLELWATKYVLSM